MASEVFLETIKKKFGLNKALFNILVQAGENPKRIKEFDKMDNDDLMFAQGIYHLQHRGFCRITSDKRIQLTDLGREVWNEEDPTLHSPNLPGTQG